MREALPLEEVADPAHSALVIIDPQHDFCPKRGAMASGSASTHLQNPHR